MKSVWYYDFLIGVLGIAADNEGITDLFLRTGDGRETFAECKTPLIEQASAQLKEYFDGKRRLFAVPFSLRGTPFQMAVWKALRDIPYGQTRSYKQIAEQVGNPKACRAVGMANNRNPIMILIPCHRVVGQDGSLVGYASGLEIKNYLLDLEKKHSQAEK